MNSKYVRFTYVLLAFWLLGLGYLTRWFFSLDADKGLPEIFINARYTWPTQPPPRGGTEPRLDGFVEGSRNTKVLLPPMPTARNTDIARSSDVKKQNDIRTCFWPGPRARLGIYTTDPDDYGHDSQLADLGRTSSMSWFKLPPGGKLELTGEFPHARMLSKVLYTEQGQVADSTYDAAIDPDQGSENPYRRGVRRDTPKRAYTLTIVNGKPPVDTTRPLNTLYTYAAPGVPMALDMRVYVPDQDRDWTGGVGLPRIKLKLANDQILPEAEACAQTAVPQRGKGISVTGWWPRVWLALNQLPWKEVSRSPAEDFDAKGMERFFNVEFTMAQSYLPALQLVQDYLQKHLPKLFRAEFRPLPWSDPYTQFGYAGFNQLFGKVFVAQGRLPNTPRTWDQTKQPMSDNMDMRYWSLCTSSFPVTNLTTDCVNDENLRTLLDAQGQYTVVVSRLADRPNNAAERCGVHWLQWGHGDGVAGGSRGYGALIDSHVLPDLEFKHGWGEVEAPRQEKPVMGAIRPFVMNLTDKDRFELLGCPISGVIIDRLKQGKDRSWRR
ncbi:MAG: hypothetical protein ORN28_07480 [Rhodoferax sp.]|nr:hypothetical protein [Rhodoferax sp.]